MLEEFDDRRGCRIEVSRDAVTLAVDREHTHREVAHAHAHERRSGLRDLGESQGDGWSLDRDPERETASRRLGRGCSSLSCCSGLRKSGSS